MSILIGLLTAVHVIVALFLVILVLMQKSQDQGVGAAFGGGMTESMFGAGTTSALVKMTIWCACIMLGTTLLLAVLHSRQRKGGSESIASRIVNTAPAATARSLPFERLLDGRRTLRVWSAAGALLLSITLGSFLARDTALAFVLRHLGYDVSYPRATNLVVELPPAGPELQQIGRAHV